MSRWNTGRGPWPIGHAMRLYCAGRSDQLEGLPIHVPKFELGLNGSLSEAESVLYRLGWKDAARKHGPGRAPLEQTEISWV